MKFPLINTSNSYSRKIKIQSADPKSCLFAGIFYISGRFWTGVSMIVEDLYIIAIAHCWCIYI